jgi:hypothetical protein
MKQTTWKLVYKPRGQRLLVSVKGMTILKCMSENHGVKCELLVLHYRDNFVLSGQGHRAPSN